LLSGPCDFRIANNRGKSLIDFLRKIIFAMAYYNGLVSSSFEEDNDNAEEIIVGGTWRFR
jgi:hypothetical protein